MTSGSSSSVSVDRISQARTALDAHVREIVAWHFHPATGCPFWLDCAARLGWDPRERINGFADLGRLGAFEDEWLRGGPVGRWVPKGLVGRPVYVFETGGTTGTSVEPLAHHPTALDHDAAHQGIGVRLPHPSRRKLQGPRHPLQVHASAHPTRLSAKAAASKGKRSSADSPTPT